MPGPPRKKLSDRLRLSTLDIISQITKAFSCLLWLSLCLNAGLTVFTAYRPSLALSLGLFGSLLCDIAIYGWSTNAVNATHTLRRQIIVRRSQLLDDGSLRNTVTTIDGREYAYRTGQLKQEAGISGDGKTYGDIRIYDHPDDDGNMRLCDITLHVSMARENGTCTMYY